MKNRFYLTSRHGCLGSNAVWHRHEERGYSSDIDQAHVYTREQAQEAWDESRGECTPISADHVDELAVLKVDCQYIPKQSEISDDINEYVAYIPKKWDGNDVYWVTHENAALTNFDKAKIFNLDEARLLVQLAIVIPRLLAENNTRRTFDFSKYNPRTMTQGAGLKMSERVKKIKRRVENPKKRWNCPKCGKISWQYNPYDFEGCKDVKCEQYNWVGY